METQRHRQMLVPLSWPQNQELAPATQGVCRKCKTAAGNIAPPPRARARHKCIGSTMSVEKVVRETWERRWHKER
eukprot:13480419-Ditylum_brightwellii.AAC.1